MSSLTGRVELLESDLTAVPPRISVYHDLPFAILRYDPAEEWELRRQVKLLATRLEAAGKDVHLIPMSELLWRAIDETEGMEEVVALERQRGYLAAQDQRLPRPAVRHPALRPVRGVGTAQGGQAAGDPTGSHREGSPHHPDVGVSLEGHRGV